jgi:hypothetical protein
MSRWMVNVRGQSFSAGSMEELKQLAKKGELGGGDIVQPPGASEWLYAVEIPELKGALRPDAMEGLDVPDASTGLSPMVKGIAAAAMALAAAGLWGYALSLKAALPKRDDPLTLLDASGQRGLSFQEVLITSPTATLKAEPNMAAADLVPMKKDDKATLLAKRGTWYKLRYNGQEGYAPVDSVVAAYFFTDDETKLNYDPLYNPDKYVYVANASWTQPVDKQKTGLSDMSAMLQNDSKFPMTDIKIVATLKDSAGQVVTQKEITVEGTIAPNHSDMIGTLSPPKGDKTTPPRILFTSDFEKMVAEDPKIADRWADGVEVAVGNDQTNEASVTIVEVRAVPLDEQPK